jgi:formate hydrogenlyase subunit 6/NADH:ubiquinone oxidoreductase subunit I
MNVCPNNALHPTLSEAGWEGLWTPILIPRIGYCELTCTLCGQVCPTGTILELTVEEKVGTPQSPPIRIGTAFVDRSRCLTWAEGKICSICRNWCPVSPKAIHMQSESLAGRDGGLFKIKHPYVDPELCIGCGTCEYACPVVGQSAIYVTAAGESRSSRNQIHLQRKITKQR